MATGEFDIIYANALPAATNVTDNDMILIIQGGRPKRALPSTMKGRPGDPGLSVYLGVDATSILWKQGPSGTWQNLISLEKIRGPKGEKPLFRKVEGTLQLKYENEPDSAYKSIFDREELKMKFSFLLCVNTISFLFFGRCFKSRQISNLQVRILLDLSHLIRYGLRRVGSRFHQFRLLRPSQIRIMQS